jgi:thymidylate synthase (FAD)
MHVEYINHYLTDQDVANFARQSFGKLAENFTKVQNDNLVKFLARGMASGDWEELITQLMHIASEEKVRELATYIRKIPEHWVPFGHPHITLKMKAPVPIARQLFKHKVGFVESEESRRYVSHKPEYYVPDFFRSAAANVKQGSGEKHYRSDAWMTEYKSHCEDAIEFYQKLIADGVCPEQARFVLPQGTEVHWILTGSLYAFANMYNQRSDPHAQQEVQDVAQKIDAIIAPLFPISWSALTKGIY